MTTKDIEALIKSAMLSCAESFCMEIVGSMENDLKRDLTESECEQVSDAVSGLLHTSERLEAERKRAEKLEQICKNEYQIRKEMEAELAALKAESEIIPVITCYSCRKEMTRDQHAEADGFCPHCDVEIELDEEDKIITAPQNPVVLPEAFYPDGDIDCELVINLSDAIAAIEAAGGFVINDE